MRKKILAYILVGILAFGQQSTVFAMEKQDIKAESYIYQEGQKFGIVKELEELEGTTLNDSSYQDWNWANVRDAFYYQDKSGNLHIVTYKKKKVYDVELNRNDQVISKKEIELQLPIFGGFHVSENGERYIISGNSNEEESREKIVIVVEKYDENWNKVGSVSINGGVSNAFEGIQYPFEAGTCSIDSYENYLIIHTARTMFVHSDGLNHQSNISFIIDTQRMELLSGMDIPYVAHSFNQFVKIDEQGTAYYLDHGDAYPRAINLYKTSPFYLNTNGKRKGVEKEILPLNAYDKIGLNTTLCEVTGFEQVGNKLITIGRSVPQDGSKDKTGNRYLSKNIFMIITDKNLQNSQFSWITNEDVGVNRKSYYDLEQDHYIFYELMKGMKEDSISSFSEPSLVKISDERLVIMYEKKDKDGNYTLCYREIDENGNILQSRNYEGVALRTNSQPIFDGKDIVWIGKNPNSKGQEWKKRYLYRIPYEGFEYQFFTIKEENLTVQEKESKKLNLITQGAVNKSKIVWTSSNKKIATVKNGKITGVSKGKATITAQIGTLKAYCDIVVKKSSKPVKNNKPIDWTVFSVKFGQIEESEVDISWNKLNGVSGYELYVRKKGEKKYKKLKTLDYKTTSYEHTGLTFGTTYYYKMRAYGIKKDGSKKYSKFWTMNFQNKYVPQTKFQAYPIKDGAQISWDLVEGVDGYEIFRRDNWNGEDEKVTEQDATTTMYIDTMLFSNPEKGWQEKLDADFHEVSYEVVPYKIWKGKRYYPDWWYWSSSYSTEITMDYIEWLGDKVLK